MVSSFRDLLVWQKSYALVLKVYEATHGFPSSEVYGLTSQIRRAAVSIPSNIAEGYCRGHRGEYIRFASIAYGSTGELCTQIMISRDLGYLDAETYSTLSEGYDELERMLAALIRSLKKKSVP